MIIKANLLFTSRSTLKLHLSLLVHLVQLDCGFCPITVETVSNSLGKILAALDTLQDLLDGFFVLEPNEPVNDETGGEVIVLQKPL